MIRYTTFKAEDRAALNFVGSPGLLVSFQDTKGSQVLSGFFNA
jgi:hypothetical protein